MKVLCIIPARSGSKSIKNKNIRTVAGKPLIAWSILHALESERVDRVIVSTDDPSYQKLAKEYGAEAPFLRPKEISGDDATDFEVFDHCIKWLSDHEAYESDVLVHLWATHPVRPRGLVDKVIDRLVANPQVDSIRTVIPARDTPYKMWFIRQGDLLSPVVTSDLHEPYNMPRQLLPKVYFQNACVQAMYTKTILEKRSMSGENILSYVMEEDFDIDYMEDLHRVEKELLRQIVAPVGGHSVGAPGPKVFCFDIDGVIATLVPNNDYRQARPINEVVALIQKLFSNGHKIVLCTARGSQTGINWIDTTKDQMKAWGVPYHELRFGKPAADYYIDDRNIALDQVFEFAKDFLG